VGLCVIAAALAALAGNWRRLRRYLARHTRARPMADTAPETLLAPEAAPQQDLPVPLEAAVKDPGPRGRVVAAYLAAMVAVESVAPVTMTQDMTLREFLNRARPGLLSILADSFARITALTEVALYSGQSINDEMAQQARRLAAAVKAGSSL